MEVAAAPLMINPVVFFVLDFYCNPWNNNHCIVSIYFGSGQPLVNTFADFTELELSCRGEQPQFHEPITDSYFILLDCKN